MIIDSRRKYEVDHHKGSAWLWQKHCDANDRGSTKKNFLRVNQLLVAKLDRSKPVVIDGNFYHKELLEDLISLLNDDVSIFTLKAPVETCISRDAARSQPHGEDTTRAVHMLVSAFDHGTVIDTTNQTAKETAMAILAH